MLAEGAWLPANKADSIEVIELSVSWQWELNGSREFSKISFFRAYHKSSIYPHLEGLPCHANPSGDEVFVTMATYWVPDLPNIEDISVHLNGIPSAFHFRICKWCLICMIQEAHIWFWPCITFWAENHQHIEIKYMYVGTAGKECVTMAELFMLYM